ncbi:universal stress protein [Haloferax mediterranei ATCC 33500]|uniref:Stress response protein n=1 Tax=Haloferax mediterranei (strain ATCC 33500 / DSM 1411 / JCM 8866 / NBRC 14739 / NCIMB 2177 / R-4) TaxID=523841 RepID=I3R7G1_HALMT|nr:universal stress protein [Haloferax mediterranei]AFK20171.1 UpsA domain-containing protein [Haloferax mediterranei ATCC 33500]AHZ23545.1 stress response protein [Haloferax mediterranei ATCC 33500]ELZ99720.1 UpsA domain-containing protein [Haloferax mediterranei ATCC 33500]MDX5987076.1 universal stress protein [Haloferax mediterranei ATCC 33500]QCQ76391.1 universal stress protein [Haloferax mediterranei ATCC 33500]
MVLYDRIIVPIDGSDGSERVATHAAALAGVHNAELHGVYVVNAGSFVGLPAESSWEGVDELLRSDAEAALRLIKRTAEEHDIPVETHVLEGSPSREIVEFAERGDCDLIVMGTHGRGGIDRLLLGSVAEKVVRASNVPVLTVRIAGGRDNTDESAVEVPVESAADSPVDAETTADTTATVDGER